MSTTAESGETGSGAGGGPIDRRRLGIYLNDHLAGATLGLEVAKRAAAENRGSTFADSLQGLCRQIDDDRRTLIALMRSLGVPPRAWKTGAAWVVEKVFRAKLNGRLTGYSPLSRLVEMESLTLGIRGKAAMWRTLHELADRLPSLDRSQLEALMSRAEEQVRTLEDLRVRAAAVAFATEER